MRCKLWVYLGTLPVMIATIKRPPGNNKKHSEASGMYWQPKKNQEHRSCAWNQAFLGFYGLFGWVHLGMEDPCLTTNSCHGADAVRVQCNNTL